MQVVELYINNVRVDLFKDESITLTDSIQNIKDISKVFSPFTQQFTLPASSTNNKIFKHFYNNDIIDGFDARFRVSALIKMNGSDFRTGQIVLNSVDMENNKAKSYKIVFYSDTVSIKEIFGEDELNALEPLSTYDFSRNSPNMQNAFQFGLQSDGVVSTAPSNRNITLPLISVNEYYGYDSTDTITYSNLHSASFFTPLSGTPLGVRDNLKPAIKARLIIDAIRTHYGIEFNMADEVINGKTIKSFFASDVFDELYLWLHREATTVTQPEEDPPVFGINYDFYGAKWNAGTDYYIYSSGTGIPSNFISANGQFTILKGESFSFRIILRNNTADFLYNLKVVDKITGEILFAFTDQESINGVNDTLIIRELTSGTLDSRTYDLEFRTDTTTQKSWVGGLTVGMTITSAVQPTWIANYTSVGTPNFPVTMFPDIWIQNYVPKMKVMDYLTTILKTFNLTAYTLRGSSKIYIQTLDDYMTLGNSYDISRNIKIDKNTVDRNIPFSRINFMYENAVTQPSLRFINKNVIQMGNLRYSAPEKYEGETFNLKVPAQRESLINIVEDGTRNITGIVYAWWVNGENPAKTTLGKPYFFFNRNVDTTAYPILSQQYTQYNAPANVSADGNHTLNFGIEVDEYTNEVNQNSLFSRFYSQYIIQSFEQQSRIVKFKAMLPMNILLNYNLNDTFIINGQQYYINSIKTNLTTQESDLELLTKQTDYTASVLT